MELGCVVCAVTCSTESITLVRKPESEQEPPPDNFMDWLSIRASIRESESKLG